VAIEAQRFDVDGLATEMLFSDPVDTEEGDELKSELLQTRGMANKGRKALEGIEMTAQDMEVSDGR
jgi:hypothetical protein